MNSGHENLLHKVNPRDTKKEKLCINSANSINHNVIMTLSYLKCSGLKHCGAN